MAFFCPKNGVHLKCLDPVFRKLMAFLFRQRRLPPNLNREPCQVLATGMARWPGIVPMAKLPEALLSRTPIATNPGESPVSMVISHTKSHLRMRCRLRTENGTSTKRESRLLPRSCSTTTTRDSPVPSPTSSSFSEDPAPEKEPCVSLRSLNSAGLTYPREICSAPRGISLPVHVARIRK
jgi:hypothetical protein